DIRDVERAQEEAPFSEEERNAWAEFQANEAAVEEAQEWEAFDRRNAEMRRLVDEEMVMEMLRSDEEDEVAAVGGRLPYAPSLDDDEDEDDEWEDDEDEA
ncbi:hypothetical protein KCU67_g3423, partial [Aureobasidium melanogenum]